MSDYHSRFKLHPMSSEAAENSPTEYHFRENGVYVSSCWLPYDSELAYKVYFVSSESGHEFGQFPVVEEALSRARSRAKLNELERSFFDL